MSFDEYRKQHEEQLKKELGWRYKPTKILWSVQFWIADQIELMKYKLYCKLYVWADCLPPDERDIPELANQQGPEYDWIKDRWEDSLRDVMCPDCTRIEDGTRVRIPPDVMDAMLDQTE